MAVRQEEIRLEQGDRFQAVVQKCRDCYHADTIMMDGGRWEVKRCGPPGADYRWYEVTRAHDDLSCAKAKVCGMTENELQHELLRLLDVEHAMKKAADPGVVGLVDVGRRIAAYADEALDILGDVLPGWVVRAVREDDEDLGNHRWLSSPWRTDGDLVELGGGGHCPVVLADCRSDEVAELIVRIRTEWSELDDVREELESLTDWLSFWFDQTPDHLQEAAYGSDGGKTYAFVAMLEEYKAAMEAIPVEVFERAQWHEAPVRYAIEAMGSIIVDYDDELEAAEASLELRDQASARARKLWQEKTGENYRPDRAVLMVWLMERVSDIEDDLANCRDACMRLASAVTEAGETNDDHEDELAAIDEQIDRLVCLTGWSARNDLLATVGSAAKLRDVVDKLMGRIEELEDLHRWRDNVDELPPPERIYEVADSINRWRGVSYLDHRDGWLNVPDDVEITHWRPLPPLPGGDDE